MNNQKNAPTPTPPDTSLRQQLEALFEKYREPNLEGSVDEYRLIPKLEALCQGIAREAVLAELERYRAAYATDLSVDAYNGLLSRIHRISAELTQKPAQGADSHTKPSDTVSGNEADNLNVVSDE